MSDYYTTAHYGSMLRDRERIDGYIDALRRAIVPGESTVLEIGTGTGIIAFAAVQAGAKRVYAVEPNPAIEVARKIACANDLGDRIEWLQAMSTDIEIPRCDIVLSDMRGGLPLLEQHIPSIVDARERLLKPDATMIAQADDIFAAPLSAGGMWRERVGHWDENPLGIDMTAAKKMTASSTYRYSADVDELLAEPRHLLRLDYRTVESPNATMETTFVATRDGTFHGMCIWFDTQVDAETTLSNAPGRPLLAYGRPYFPVLEPFEVRAGEALSFRLDAKLVMGSYVWRWRGEIDAARTFDHSTFDSIDVSAQHLELYRADGTPCRSKTGERALFVLRRLDGQRPLRQIAEELHAADAEVTSVDAAMALISQVVSTYGVLRG